MPYVFFYFPASDEELAHLLEDHKGEICEAFAPMLGYPATEIRMISRPLSATQMRTCHNLPRLIFFVQSGVKTLPTCDEPPEKLRDDFLSRCPFLKDIDHEVFIAPSAPNIFWQHAEEDVLAAETRMFDKLLETALPTIAGDPENDG